MHEWCEAVLRIVQCIGWSQQHCRRQPPSTSAKEAASRGITWRERVTFERVTAGPARTTTTRDSQGASRPFRAEMRGLILTNQKAAWPARRTARFLHAVLEENLLRRLAEKVREMHLERRFGSVFRRSPLRTHEHFVGCAACARRERTKSTISECDVTLSLPLGMI